MSILRATILDYTPQSHSGRLITDSGIEYRFSGYSWTESTPPKAGDLVQITITNNGVVESIYYLSECSPVPITSPQDSNSIPSSLNNISSKVDNNSNPSYSNLEVDFLDSLYMREGNYGFIDWSLKALKNFDDFKGRSRRKEYWYFCLSSSLFALTCNLIFYIIVTLSFPGYDTASAIMNFKIILNLILLIPTLAVGSRRLHDIGRSGWWQLIIFIPFVGWLVLLYFMFSNTSPQSNKWGPPAKPMY